MNKMFGFRSSHGETILSTPHEIGVTQRDILQFRSINKDEEQVRTHASLIKMSQAELRDLPSDIALVLHTKTQHLAVLRRNINTITSVLNAIGLMTIGGSSQLIWFLTLIRDNNADLTRMIFPYFEPDYNISQPETVVDDKPIVVSGANTPKLSAILQRFKVPEVLSSDIQDIAEKGFSVGTISSMASFIISKLAKRDASKTNTSAFDFE